MPLPLSASAIPARGFGGFIEPPQFGGSGLTPNACKPVEKVVAKTAKKVGSKRLPSPSTVTQVDPPCFIGI